MPEYSKVLGPSAKVKGSGPEISHAVFAQKMVYVVAVLSYKQCQSSKALSVCESWAEHDMYTGKYTASQAVPILITVPGHIDRHRDLCESRRC